MSAPCRLCSRALRMLIAPLRLGRFRTRAAAVPGAGSDAPCEAARQGAVVAGRRRRPGRRLGCVVRGLLVEEWSPEGRPSPSCGAGSTMPVFCVCAFLSHSRGKKWSFAGRRHRPVRCALPVLDDARARRCVRAFLPHSRRVALLAFGEPGGERGSGMAPPPACDGARSAGRDHPPAAAPALGAEIDDPVGGGDDVEVVLDDEHRVAGREERVECGQQARYVFEVEPGGRLVEDEQDVGGSEPGVVRREVLGELQSLRLAAGERRHRLAEPQVAEPHRRQRRERPHDLGAPGEEGEGVVDRHLQDVGDGAWGVGDRSRARSASGSAVVSASRGTAPGLACFRRGSIVRHGPIVRGGSVVRGNPFKRCGTVPAPRRPDSRTGGVGAEGAPGSSAERAAAGGGVHRFARARSVPIRRADLHVEHLAPVAAAVAVGAAQVHVAQELHLDMLEAVPAAARAAPVAGVEAERPRRVAALDGDGLGREALSDGVERADVARGVRTGGLADGRLVHEHQAAQRFEPVDRRMLARRLDSLSQMLARAAVQHVDGQGGLAGAADAGHADEAPERDVDVDAGEVVGAGAADLDALGRRRRGRARLDPPLSAQPRPGERAPRAEQGARGAAEHDLPAPLAGSRPHVHDPVRREHDLRVVLDHQQGVAGVAQLVQHRDHAGDVARMQPDARLVEHEQRVHERGAERGGQVDALDLAAAQGAGLAVEREVAEPDLHQVPEPPADLREQQLGRVVERRTEP